MSYLPDISWRTLASSVISHSPYRFKVTVSPLDINEPGARGVVDTDCWFIDYLGYPFKVESVTGNVLVVYDVNERGWASSYKGPVANRVGYVYKPKDGAFMLTQAQLRYLDPSAEDRVRGIENSVLWSHRGFSVEGKDLLGNAYAAVNVTELLFDESSLRIAELTGGWQGGKRIKVTAEVVANLTDMFELVPNAGDSYIRAKLPLLGDDEITAYSTGSLGDIWDAMPVATINSLGGIIVGSSLTITSEGVLNINGDTFNLTNYYTKAQTDTLLTAKFDKTGGSITGDVSITGNLTITGLGKEFIADVETVRIADNLAVINYGEMGAGVTAGFSGWEIDRGTATHYRFGFSESPGYFQVGKVGDLQTVATREDAPLSGGYAKWNATLKRFDTVVINNIVTGTGTAGQVSFWDGTGSQTGSSNLVWNNAIGLLSLPNGTGGRGVAINNGGIRFVSTSIGGWATALSSYDSSGALMKPLIGGYGDGDSHIYTYIGGSGYNDAAIYAFPNNTVAINKTSVTSGYMLDVNGAIRAAGNIYATGNITGAGEVTAYTASDARLKANITSLAGINALDIINALNPVTYTWNSKAVQLNTNKNTSTINYGLIAQELEAIVPDLIRPIYGEYKTYDDRGLMTIMLQAIKELKAEVDELKTSKAA